MKPLSYYGSVQATPTLLIKALGDRSLADLLAQLVYWQQRSGGKYWFFKSAAQLEHETGFIPRTQHRMLARLTALDLLEQTNKGGYKHRRHFHVHLDRLHQLLLERARSASPEEVQHLGWEKVREEARRASPPGPDTPHNHPDNHTANRTICPTLIGQSVRPKADKLSDSYRETSSSETTPETNCSEPLASLGVRGSLRSPDSPRSARLVPCLASLGTAAREAKTRGEELAEEEKIGPESQESCDISRYGVVTANSCNSSVDRQPGSPEGLVTMKNGKLGGGGGSGPGRGRLGGRAAFEGLPRVVNRAHDETVRAPKAPDPSVDPQDESERPIRGAAPPDRSERRQEAAAARRADEATERAQIRAEARELAAVTADEQVRQPVADMVRPARNAGPAEWDRWLCCTAVRSKREGGGVRPPDEWTAPDFDRYLAAMNKTTFPNEPAYVSSGRTRGSLAQWLKPREVDGLTRKQRAQQFYEAAHHLFVRFDQYQRDHGHKLKPPLTPGLIIGFFDMIRIHQQAPQTGSNRTFFVEDYMGRVVSGAELQAFAAKQEQAVADRHAAQAALWRREAEKL